MTNNLNISRLKQGFCF